MNSSKIIKNLSRFRLVTFDVTDTLIQAKFHPGHKYAQTAESHGYPNIDPELLTQNFRNEFKTLAKLYPNFGKSSNEVDWKDWWRLLVYMVFIKSGANIATEDLNKITNTLISEYRTADCWQKCEGADEIVERVKKVGKQIGIISNYDPSLHGIIEQMKLPKFDFVFTSYEIDALKPNPKIFDAALETFNVKGDEALHIGNTIELDYIGAKNAGWSSVHITNKAVNSIEHPAVDPNHVYPTLRDFLAGLENDDIKW